MKRKRKPLEDLEEESYRQRPLQMQNCDSGTSLMCSNTSKNNAHIKLTQCNFLGKIPRKKL